MGYQIIDPDSIEPTPDRPCVHRAIADGADLSAVAVNRYTAEPGEQLPLSYHYHDEQEELFYVLSGELAVETPEEVFTVGTDECFVAKPNHSHRAYNPVQATESVSVLAVGAPRVDDAHAYSEE
jgi:mannose-6-phosphate isomerase-like protein (cupin superfamily)